MIVSSLQPPTCHGRRFLFPRIKKCRDIQKQWKVKQMKKVLISLIIGAAGGVNAWADASLCVRNTQGSCVVPSVVFNISWDINCGVDVTGIGVCSNQRGSVGNVSLSVTGTTTQNSNYYCWCRMLTPAVSQWIMASNMGTVAACLTNCASICASYAGSNSQKFFANILY